MIYMAILWQEESKATRILLRMSHAIYDGMSLPIIMETLRKLYHQQEAYAEPPLSSFAAYVADLDRQTSDTSYSYWRSLLEGSSMPELTPVTGSGQQIPMRMAFTKDKVMPLPASKGEGITISTIISCAWAHVLAQFTGKSDVVFGDTISGRNVVNASISSTVVGCCATNVPMRIRFTDGSGSEHSILQLLKQVQDQQRSRITHEGVGFRSMIRQCTDWSPATYFTSIVNHRPARPAAQSASGQIGFQVSTITTEKNPLTTWYDLAVLSRENDGTVEMSLGYSAMAFHPDTAQALLDDLVHIVHILVDALPSTLDQTILHGTQAMPRSASKVAMLRPVTTQQQKNPSQNGGRPGNDMPTNKPNNTISTILDTIWSSTFPSARTSAGMLSSDEPSTPEDVRYLPFYQLGGDLLDAAHFIASIQRRIKTTKAHMNGDAVSNEQQHAQVTVDDILQHPSLAEFASVLHQRRLELV